LNLTFIGSIDLFHPPTLQLPYWVTPIALFFYFLSMMILTDALPRHFPQLSFGGSIAYFTSQYVVIYAHAAAFAPWLASTAVGIAGNLYGQCDWYMLKFLLKKNHHNVYAIKSILFKPMGTKSKSKPTIFI